MSHQVILRVIAKLLIPFILLFGFYVIMHGEVSPGGGFQGGVILASAFILYALVFGVKQGRRVLSQRLVDALACLGVLLYAGVGVVSMMLGGAFLDYNLLIPTDPPSGQALGITLVEIGVGLTVAAVMIILFNEFASGKMD
jgi:multicomponent Na+:H+ antiporter subunit B